MLSPSGQPAKPPQSEVNATLVLGIAPFFAAGLLSVLALAATHRWGPTQLLPGESLALPGLLTTLAAGAGVARWQARVTTHAGLRALGRLLIGLTSLMAAPVFTLGLMPVLNGLRTGTPEATTMVLQRLEQTPASKSRTLHHWAYLQPAESTTSAHRLRAGRYFIDEDTYTRWHQARPAEVDVAHAPGLMGARILLGFPQNR